MWLMILIAVHVSDPRDVPGRISIDFVDQVTCEQSLSTLTYWLKFTDFRIEGKCVKKI